MWAITCQVLTILGMGAAPTGAPFASIARIGIIIPGRVITLDIGKVKDHFGVISRIIEDDVIVADQRGIGPVRVTGHENEAHCGIGLLKSIHGVQVELHRLLTVAGLLATPRPHREVK